MKQKKLLIFIAVLIFNIVISKGQIVLYYSGIPDNLRYANAYLPHMEDISKISFNTSFSVIRPKILPQNIYTANLSIPIFDNLSISITDIHSGLYTSSIESTGIKGRTQYSFENLFSIDTQLRMKNPHIFIIPHLGFYVYKPLPEIDACSIMGSFSCGWYSDNMIIELSANNIGKGINFKGIKQYNLPSRLSLNNQYKYTFAKKHITIANVVLGTMINDKEQYCGASLEYSYNNYFDVSFSKHVSSTTSYFPSFISLGVGINYSNFRTSFVYILSESAINKTFAITLGLVL